MLQAYVTLVSLPLKSYTEVEETCLNSSFPIWVKYTGLKPYHHRDSKAACKFCKSACVCTTPDVNVEIASWEQIYKPQWDVLN